MEMFKTKKDKSIVFPYALGTLGLQTIIGFTENFQSEFYNKAFVMIDGLIITRCAVILAVAKFISCVLDPVIGMIIDRSTKKGASLLFWLRSSVAPLICLTVFLFFRPPFDRFGGKPVMYAFIAITAILWNITMSCTEIPLQSMISFISQNESNGKRLVSLTNITKSLGLGAPPILVTIIMFVTDGIRGAGETSDMEYYFINVLSVSIIGLLFSLPLLIRNPKLQRSATVDGLNRVTLYQMIEVIRKNKHILIVFFINILGFARNLSNVILLQSNGALIGKIQLCGKTLDTTTNATWIPFLIGNFTSILALFAVPAINKRLKEKATYLLFSIALFSFSVVAFIFYVLLPEGSALRYGNGAMYMLMVMSGIGSFLMGANEYIPLAMTAEIADIEVERGVNGNPAIPYAVLTMSIKLGAAAGVILGLYLVGKSGYNQLIYEAGAVTVKMQNQIMCAFMLIPGVSSLLSALPAFFYKLGSE